MNARMGPTRAEIGDRSVDNVTRRVGVAFEQDCNRHDHAGSAKSALDHACGGKGLLNRVAPIPRKPFDRRDETPFKRANPRLTTAHGASIDINGARSAVARSAAIFGASQIGCVSERPEQRRRSVQPVFDGLVVDRKPSHASWYQPCQPVAPLRQILPVQRRRGSSLHAGRVGGRK
jgi:hypothetical protein